MRRGALALLLVPSLVNAQTTNYNYNTVTASTATSTNTNNNNNTSTSTNTSTRQTVDAVSGSVRASDAMTIQTQRAMLDQLRQQDVDQQRRIKDLETQMDDKIKRVLDNPLNGKD